METIKFGLKYLKGSLWKLIVSQILSFTGILGDLFIPLITGILIDFVIKDSEVRPDSGGVFHFLLSGKYGNIHSLQLFYSIAVVYTIFVALRLILIYIRDIFQEYVGLELETKLRYATYHKLMELDSQTISDYNSGELLQVLNSDTIMYKELFAHRIPYFADSIFILGSAVFFLYGINISFIVIPIILMPLIAVTVINFRKRARDNFKAIRKASSNMNLTVQENIAAVRIIRSFTNEDAEKEKFEKVNKGFLDANLNQIRLSSRFDATLNTLKQIAYVGTLIIGAVLAIRGKMSVGNILASASYVMMIMNQIASLNNHIFQMQRQTVAGYELKKFMDCESRVSDNADSELFSCTPDIKVDHVSLTIGEQQILKDVSVDIPYGKKLGIVGPTGSGKSVLLKFLVRTRDMTGGQITIDGHDIKDYSLKSLRDMYSYVFQDVFLFSNTVDSNIAYSNPDIEENMVVQAATKAQAHGFIQGLSEGYRTIIGERGLGISGGQKQRVSVARAFLKNAPVLVLDDSTSALDVETERRLLKVIYEDFNDKTVIITAHRLSSVKDCDEILYMDDGVVAERGTFEELMALDGRFAHVYKVQAEQQSELADYDSAASRAEAAEGGING
ncbi:MAG: ABC transporter ATP-binding protein [Lachnospiraceae bacterium]|nr:ABC transporter ATP-binding protein [Lachnospiraceae bacterium]